MNLKAGGINRFYLIQKVIFLPRKKTGKSIFWTFPARSAVYREKCLSNGNPSIKGPLDLKAHPTVITISF
jgi:hypothetical protein